MFVMASIATCGSRLLRYDRDVGVGCCLFYGGLGVGGLFIFLDRASKLE
jgi:hypothetical protein